MVHTWKDLPWQQNHSKLHGCLLPFPLPVFSSLPLYLLLQQSSASFSGPQHEQVFRHICALKTTALLVASRLPVSLWLAKGKLQPLAELFARLCLAFQRAPPQTADSARLPQRQAVTCSHPVKRSVRARTHTSTLSWIPVTLYGAKRTGNNWYHHWVPRKTHRSQAPISEPWALALTLLHCREHPG